MKSYLTILLVALTLQGCLPALIAVMAADDASRRTSQQTFLISFNQVNLQREIAGLEPLDFCSEAYKYSKGWARTQKQCTARIVRYEGGDPEALEI